MADPTPPTGEVQQAVAAGSSVIPKYTRRDMTMYALTESEVATISSINSQVASDIALASFLGSAGLSVYVNAIFYTTLSPAGALAKGYVAPLVFVLAAAFLVRAIFGTRRRSKLWSDLKNESKVQ